MAIGDTVKVGFGNMAHGLAPDNVPVYELEHDANGEIRFDMNGYAYPKPCGGVKGGSDAVVAGDSIKVLRSYVQKMDNSTKSFGGQDFILLFPVRFTYYQKIAFVQQDHMHLVYIPGTSL